MGWRELKNNSFIITTGDGEVYTPIWKNPKTSDELNAVALQFNNIESALVKRGKYGLTTYDLEIYFQGKNHLDEFLKFRKSSRVKRNWIVDHPYYGRIVCQPTGLSYDHASDNVTVVTGQLWETIEIPNSNNDLKEKADIQKTIDAVLKGVEQQMLVEDSDLSYINQNTEKSAKLGVFNAKTAKDLESINKAINKTNSAINNIGIAPQFYMLQAEKIFRAPATFYATAKQRIENIRASFDSLRNSANILLSLPQKIYLEASLAFNVLAASDALTFSSEEIRDIQIDEVGEDGTNPQPELNESLKSRNDVLEFAEKINQLTDDYIDTLELMQTEHDNRLDSYHPNPDTVRNVKAISKQTSVYLYETALSASQEREYIVPDDMPILKLSGIIGVSPEDIIERNDLSQNDIILVPKSKSIKYTV